MTSLSREGGDWRLVGRRLPVYFLIDRSDALRGTSIVAVQTGIQFVQQSLKEHHLSRELVYLSVIDFAEQTHQVDLSPIDLFSPPGLEAAGPAHLASALTRLEEALQYDIIPSTPERAGDFNPFVFLFMGSIPTDAWQTAAAEITRRIRGKKLNVIGIALGERAGYAAARALTPHVVRVRTTATDIAAIFQWIADIIVISCNKAVSSDEAHALQLPPPPSGVD
jgi:uncharacterized protein YegL